MSYVKLTNVQKQYPKQEYLTVKDFNLEIKQGEFIVFVGPSGCGKSTTLRMIAGLEEISGGDIEIDGTIVNTIQPKDRDIAMVFQNYALYPHMSVQKNIEFGLKIQKMPKEEMQEKVDWAAEILGLDGYLDRLPKDLSGGQRQRVALGRAIVRNPKVFLMDEPLSNLDAKLRGKMRNEITKLHKSLNATTIYVTHDQIEAMTMADRIVVMNDGDIQQIGTPLELYDTPANLFVAGFIGAPQMNFLNVVVKEDRVYFDNDHSIKLTEGIFKKLEGFEGETILGIRPEHIKTDNLSLTALVDQTVTQGIDTIEHMGHEQHIFTYLGEKDIILRVQHSNKLRVEDKITFAIDINKCHFFDINSHKALN